MRTVVIPDEDRRKLHRRARSKGAPARVVERARVVLLAGDGVPGKQIAAGPVIHAAWRTASSTWASVTVRSATGRDGRFHSR